MVRDWAVDCKECGRPLHYSASSLAKAKARGESPPERCITCRSVHSRAISRLAVKYLDMVPGLPIPGGGVKTGRLGKLNRPERIHKEVQNPDFVPPPTDTFGIQDDEVVELLTDLEETQVAVVVAGTGSGKSTFLPWRLMVAPPPFEPDHLTRYGKIVVTQPRIEASTGIPEYVAKTLHGSTAGPGLDIGYENSKNKDKSDSRNKLVYLTDGTLVNMIRKGSLHEVSTVVIDEAHERSLNIDLILALLRRELHGLPHLKVLIVSATIDTDTFKNFFEPDFKVLVKPMKSKGIHAVHERWWSGPEIPRESWPAQMPARAAATVAEVLRWMVDDIRPGDIPDEVEAYQGDVLVFLTGKRPIEEAIRLTNDLIKADPVLSKVADTIELLPLYGELPTERRKRPLTASTRSKKTKYRVIYSTNLAETSLTIDGVRHVIDSGLINQKTWDPATATESMQQVPHSQHGLRQRRGRAGRTHPGVWHCLYSEAQFQLLNSDTPPEITRAPLTTVVLAAAVAGVSDPASLTWLAPGPPAGEMSRALASLRAIGAIDEHGDPTPVGRELASTRTSFDDAAILITADQAGCAVEAATVLAAKSDECKNRLLLWSKRWPAAAKIYVDDVHSTLLNGAIDDVDVVCRIWAGWEAQPDEPARRAWAQRHYVDVDVMVKLALERKKLLEPLMAKTRSSEIRPIDLRMLSRLRAAIAWANPNSFYVADRAVTTDDGGSAVGELTPWLSDRSDAALVAAMHTAARPLLDDESWVSRHLPGGRSQLVLLNRQMRNRFLTPLAPPTRVLLATFCVIVATELIFSGDDWLAAVEQIEMSAPVQLPPVLPGDRFLVDLLPSPAGSAMRIRVLATLTPAPDPTIEIEYDDAADDGDEWQVITDELPSDVGGRADAQADDRYDDDPLDEPDIEPPPVVALPQTDLLELSGEIDPTHAHEIPSGEFEVVVIAVAEGGHLICIPDTRAEHFGAFADEYLGQSVTLALDHVRIFARDRAPALVARHVSSGFVTAVDARHIGLGLRYSQVRELPRTASWDFMVAAADRDLMTVELSQTGRTMRALTRLAGDRQPLRATGQIVDVSPDSVRVAVRIDGTKLTPDDPPIIFRVWARELPQAPDRIRLKANVPIALTWPDTQRVTIELPDLGDVRVPSGPWEVRGRELAATARLTVLDWERLVALSFQIPDRVDAARLRNDAAYLASKSLSPRIRVIDEVLFSAAVDRGSDDAVVTAVLDDGALRVMTPLGEQLIRSREVELFKSLGHSTAVGASVPIFVDRPDTELASLSVRLFDPAERSRLAVGDVVQARIGLPTARGTELHVHTLAGVEGLLNPTSLTDVPQEGAVVSLRVAELGDDDSPFRLSGRLAALAHAELSPQLAATIAPAKGNHGWDLRPFTQLIGSKCDVVISGSPPTHLSVYGHDSGDGDDVATLLIDALTGPMMRMQVPNHSPLRADSRKVLREVSVESHCVLIDGKDADARGYPESVVWIFAPSEEQADAAVALLEHAYPQVWVSSWFKRRGTEWQAAKNAVRSMSAQLRSITGFDDRDKPIFRAILDCDPSEVNELLDTARSECSSIPDGEFMQDPTIRVVGIVQDPPTRGAASWPPNARTERSSLPSSDWSPGPGDDTSLVEAPSSRSPSSTWAPMPFS